MVVRNEWRKRASGGGIRLACDERTGLVRSVAIMQVRTLTDHPSAHFDGSFIHSTIHLCLFPQMNPMRRRTMPSKNAEIALLPGIWPQYGMLGTAEINYSTWKSDLTILTGLSIPYWGHIPGKIAISAFLGGIMCLLIGCDSSESIPFSRLLFVSPCFNFVHVLFNFQNIWLWMSAGGNCDDCGSVGNHDLFSSFRPGLS